MDRTITQWGWIRLAFDPAWLNDPAVWKGVRRATAYQGGEERKAAYWRFRRRQIIEGRDKFCRRGVRR